MRRRRCHNQLPAVKLPPHEGPRPRPQDQNSSTSSTQSESPHFANHQGAAKGRAVTSSFHPGGARRRIIVISAKLNTVWAWRNSFFGI